MRKIISFGHRCSSSALIKALDLKTESYPFDWMVSKLRVIQDCIETNFTEFFNLENYKWKQMETCNIIDGQKIFCCNENVHVNTFYETNQEVALTYECQLAFNHKNIINNLEYYERCVRRLYDFLNSDGEKAYLYIHPILGPNDYNNNTTKILKEFDDFHNYIVTKTRNIFGIFIILIKSIHPSNISIHYIVIKETTTYIVYLVFCNNNFFDGGDPCIGDFSPEVNIIVNLIYKHTQYILTNSI
jgi:hypothetical protein